MMPLGPSAYNPPAAYNPYWTGIQPGMEGYMGPFAGAMPYMPYGMGPLDMAFGGVMPQDPFAAQGYMMPVVPPQRYAISELIVNCSFAFQTVWKGWMI